MVDSVRGAAVGRAFESGFLALVPPYVSLSPLDSLNGAGSLPLGTVLVGLGDETLEVLAALLQLALECPWVVPCLILAPKYDALEALLSVVGEFRRRLVILTRGKSSRPRELVAAILRGARRRPLPTPALLSQLVSQRVRQPGLEKPLKNQFDAAADHTSRPAQPSVATYSRLFRQYGPYTARIGAPSLACAGTRKPRGLAMTRVSERGCRCEPSCGTRRSTFRHRITRFRDAWAGNGFSKPHSERVAMRRRRAVCKHVIVIRRAWRNERALANG